MAENKSLTLVETQKDAQLAVLEGALREVSGEYQGLVMRLEERLDGLDRMAEDIGWSDISGFGQDDGPDLPQLQKRSKQIRSALALNPHIKRGAQLRISYVWGDPISYDGVPGIERGSTTGRGNNNIGSLVRKPLNQHYVFGPEAREERERTLFTDGMYFLLGDDSAKTLAPVPIAEVSAYYSNPDNRAEVWAYRRSWSRWDAAEGKETPVVRWYFTDLFKDESVDSIIYNSQVETVDRTKTIIDGSVNKQVGWALGFPDAGCVLEWVRLYNKFIRSGLDMNSAMASIWANAKAATAKGTQNAAAKIAGMSGSGNTASGNVELAPLATAGKTYDFSAGTSILSIVAAGLEVSVVALSASPADSGSSYGAAATLDLPARLSTERRRAWHCAFDERVLRWLGAKDPVASFPPLVDATELYRLKQSAALDLASGLYGGKELKAKYEGAEGNRDTFGPIPDGWTAPNPGAKTDIGVQASSGDQGVGNGAGRGGVNDMRSDSI